MHRCYNYCPDCYSEIGYKVRWTKSVTLTNAGSTDVFNIKVKANILKSTYSQDDVKLYTPNGSLYPIDVINITEGYINWTVDRINASETQVWTIKLNSTPPTVSEYNETEGTTWTKWINITGASDINYEKIWSYSTINKTLVHLNIYDNTTYLREVTYESEWGPPTAIDTDSDGYYDLYQWVVPNILAGSVKKIVLRGTLGIVRCEIVNKTISNAPVTAGENVEWEWTINCTNLVDVALSFSENIRLPLESTRIMLDDKPIEPGFLIVPPYGPYITIVDTLPAYSSKSYSLKFRTPPVTVEVSPPIFPKRFFVGEKATLIQNIHAKNWASENITEVLKSINIRYGEDLKVYEEGELIDSVDLVRGYYTLNITNISAYESREYTISYKSPIAEASVKTYSRTIINNSQYIFYPVKIRSLADFPLSNVYIRFKHNKPYTCKDVAWVWKTDEMSYINAIAKKVKELEFYCENNDTIVELDPFSGPGEEQYILIFVTEVKSPPYPQISEIIYNIFEILVNIIRNFIEIIIGVFK